MDGEATYFYLYKITNMINGHFYYGVHRTQKLDDNYMGSGHRLWKAYEKYGIENFKKEILEFFPDIDSMYNREAEIVTNELVKDPNCYNLVRGGWAPHYVVKIKGHKMSKKAIEKTLKTKEEKGTYKRLSIENSGENNPFFQKYTKNIYEQTLELGPFLFKNTNIPDVDILKILNINCHIDRLFKFYQNRGLIDNIKEENSECWPNPNNSTTKKKTIFENSNFIYNFVPYKEEPFLYIQKIKEYFQDDSLSNSSLYNCYIENAKKLANSIIYFKHIGALKFKERKNIKVNVKIKDKYHLRTSPKDIYEFDFTNINFLNNNGGFYVINNDGQIIQESRLSELARIRNK